MRLYVDTSALAKLYYPEPESDAVARWVSRQGGPMVWTVLHDLELSNAFALKVYRKEIEEEQCSSAMRAIAEDRVSGVLLPVLPDQAALWSKAGELARRHTPTLGTRSLDVLHVAAALMADCAFFLTNDDRQLRLARVVGLETVAVAEI